MLHRILLSLTVFFLVAIPLLAGEPQTSKAKEYPPPPWHFGGSLVGHG